MSKFFGSPARKRYWNIFPAFRIFFQSRERETRVLLCFKVVLVLFKKKRGSEFSSYKIELRNRVTQNDVILRVTNSKMFIEILLSSYQLDFVKH